ncbi:RhuM family protein [Corynebacterium glyciniphilum]|uniref:RhuM family protein n=1 Tax=Corynebacterium glyciniphilum TaxID=1404244 RepID=UPI002652ED1D|nr:RhuM family protein [Corynebacterium glyciniphilum]MDN6706587.1 virulence RhuM family protein [Corynebacterium glyciniphilum]
MSGSSASIDVILNSSAHGGAMADDENLSNDLVTKSIDGFGEFVIYTTEDGDIEVHLRVVDGTVWLTQRDMAVSVPSISMHLRDIYDEGELTRDRTIQQYLTVRSEGDRTVRRTVDHYNLDAVLAVGYRVRGRHGVQFRTWARGVLSEYLVKGFAMDDERLKDPRGRDYFSELLERIRDIRSSEARMYQQVRDVFALADDYDKADPRSQSMFRTIQNKLHYAVTGQTAGEIIATRCDPTADNLGLTSFSGREVRKKDVSTAKNYLTSEELDELNRLVDQFIEFNDYESLDDAGRVHMEEAKRLAGERYALYDAKRRAPEEAEAAAAEIAELQEIERRILTDRERLAPRRLDEGRQ